MNDSLILILAGLGGSGLGVVFFGGLWWTIRKTVAGAVSVKHPALWFLVSLWLRTGITLVGFYLISGTHWERLLLCLLGFIAARFAITRLGCSTDETFPCQPGGANYAP